ncbi:MAG: hypothetical protein Q9170_001397 [Blastenia crenularia]
MASGFTDTGASAYNQQVADALRDLAWSKIVDWWPDCYRSWMYKVIDEEEVKHGKRAMEQIPPPPATEDIGTREVYSIVSDWRQYESRRPRPPVRIGDVPVIDIDTWTATENSTILYGFSDQRLLNTISCNYLRMIQLCRQDCARPNSSKNSERALVRTGLSRVLSMTLRQQTIHVRYDSDFSPEFHAASTLVQIASLEYILRWGGKNTASSGGIEHAMVERSGEKEWRQQASPTESSSAQGTPTESTAQAKPAHPVPAPVDNALAKMAIPSRSGSIHIANNRGNIILDGHAANITISGNAGNISFNGGHYHQKISAKVAGTTPKPA